MSNHLGPVDPVEAAGSGGCGETVSWPRMAKPLSKPRSSAAPTRIP